MTRRAFHMLLPLAGLALLLSSCASRRQIFAQDPEKARVVAIVNGDPITQLELDIAINQVRQYQISIAASGFGEETDTRNLTQRGMDKAINELLLIQEAKRRNIKVTDKEIDNYLRDFKGSALMQMGAMFQDHGSKKQYQAQLREKIREELLKGKLKKQVLQDIKVPFQEVYDYYQANQEMFVQDATIRLHHILVAVPKDASDAILEKAQRKINILRRLVQKGRNFADLAKEHSDDEMSADFGGDLGYFRKSDKIPGIHNEAFGLKTGKVSAPIRDADGFHLLLVTEKTGVKVQPITAAEAFITNKLRVQKNILVAKELTASLRENAKIKIIK